MEERERGTLWRQSVSDQRVKWPGPVDFIRCEPDSLHAVLALGTVTTASANAVIKCEAAKLEKRRFQETTRTLVKLRKMCLDRRRENDPLARKSFCALDFPAAAVCERCQAEKS